MLVCNCITVIHMKTVVLKTLKKELKQNLLWDLDANNDNYSLWMSKGGSKTS